MINRTGSTSRRLITTLLRVGLAVLSIALFVMAIQLIKTGATDAATLLGTYLHIDNVPNALGFGWFAAYLAMSGSPVAAVSVSFLAAGVLSRLSAFAMITGSRLGASFIVLFVGFIYVLRGHERRTGLAMGLLSLTVTASIYLPAMALGSLLLATHVLDVVRFDEKMALTSFLDQSLDPVVQALSGFLPGWAVVLLGLGVLWLAFFLFDRVLPEVDLEKSRFSEVAHLVYRPLVMFVLGSILTLLTLSVSLSVSLLVPLSARGYVRRENAIPYIMGANVTTFIDTLLATVLLSSGDAFTVVLVEITSVAAISLVVLVLIFRPYERVMLELVEWVTASNRHLVVFMLILLFTPLALIVI